MTNFFGTDGIRGQVGKTPITPEFVLKLGWACGKVFSKGVRSPKVIIGKDTRISGYLLESALEAGLSAAGVNIALLGPMPTPGIAYLTRTLHAQAGIVISASHNPYYDNGIKFFSQDGKKLPDAMEASIEAQLNEPMSTVDPAKLGRATRINDASGRYIEFCKRSIPFSTELWGLKIVVDCAHGAAYHIAPAVLKELGAEVIEIGVKPNGLNINERCGSTHPETIQKAVLEHRADVGIALDGDADRVVMVDAEGELLDGDDLIYIIAKSGLVSGEFSGGVVGTLMTNLGLEKSLNQLGIDFVRTQVGDRHILAELDQRGWILGGETSGHVLWLSATTTGDGIISSLQILHAMQQQQLSLHQLKQGLTKLPQLIINVPAAEPLQVAKTPEVAAAILDAEKALKNSGRVVLRPSGTEPLVRVMVEGEDHSMIESIAQGIAKTVTSALKKAASA